MIIYRTTCLVNNKIYIGKDKHNRQSYLGSGKAFLLALEKYGKNNFIKETLEICSSIEHMNEREIYWIENLKARDRTIGYNIQKGGDGGDTYSLLTPEKLIEVKKTISEGVKRSIANGHKTVGFTSEVASRAGYASAEKMRIDKNAAELKRIKQNETKLKNGTHPSCEESKKKNSEGVKKYWEENPDARKIMGEKVSKINKGVSQKSRFLKKYGELVGNEKYNEYIQEMKFQKTGVPISDSHKYKISETLKEKYKNVVHHLKDKPSKLRGKTLEELHGKEKADEIRNKMKEAIRKSGRYENKK